MSAAEEKKSEPKRKLIAEAGGDGDLVAPLGAAAVQDGGTGLGGHADQESVDLAATAAVGLEGAFRHGDSLSGLLRWKMKCLCWRPMFAGDSAAEQTAEATENQYT